MFLSWIEPGDEFVNEEPVEYAYEDQAFDNSENLAGKMTTPRNHFYLCFASCSLYCYIMPPILPCQPLTNLFLANRCLAKLLLIADSCHSCFARHLQTVHPIPVIFISISTEINSSFQWRTWFAKLMPFSIFSFRSTHMHRISYLAYHTCFASCCLCISRD